MKTVFKITKYDKEGKMFSASKNFDTYEEAEKKIKEDLPPGIYQIQKVFVKS